MSTRRRPALAHAVRTAVVAATSAAAAIAVLLPVAEPTAAPTASATAVAAPTAVAPVASSPTVSAPVELAAVSAPVRAPSSVALDSALSKIGSPYRYGASGPNAFDCSGLVSWAFKNAGVPLPRTSRAMSQVGTPIARGDLQPGDLVFFYRPVSHVAIYIGDGKVVHASSRKSPVKISNLADMNFTSARRV